MPEIEESRPSTAHSKGSRESSAESSNASAKEISPKDAALLETEVATLSNALSAVSNEAARVVTRQHWRKCLIGTEKDQSFLVRAILKHSTPHVYVRAMEDYGNKLLEVASDEFLDQALELRLPSINADKLVALLAKAKRLGYDEHDVVDEEEAVVPAPKKPAHNSEPAIERVPNPAHLDTIMAKSSDRLLEVQNRNALAATATAVLMAPYQPAVLQGSYSQNMNLPTRRKAKDPSSRKFVCPDCTASFAQQGGLTYHMERKVCHRPAPQFRWFCKTCSKGFTTSGGKLYHEQNKVCEAHQIAKATPPTLQPQQGPVMIKPMPSPHLTDGQPSLGYAGRPNPVRAPPMAGPSYQHVPYHGPYSTPYDTSRATQNTSAHAPPTWPSQRVEPKVQLTIPHYPDLRTSIGSSTQSTPARSSPGSEHTSGRSQVLDSVTEAEMNAKIAAEVSRFENKCREIPDTMSAADREEALNKEKRGHATRKSQIRKKYGIQIRTSKLQPANFVRLPSQGDSPVLAPISRISAFRAPSASMTPTYSISTPSSIEQGRQRPIVEHPDPKRRKLDDSPSIQQESNFKNSPDTYSALGGLERRTSDLSPEVLEVDDVSKQDRPTTAEPQTGMTKVPKKVQWETLPREQPPSQLTTLRDISNRTLRAKPPKSGKSNTELVVLTSEDGSNSGDDDSNEDPDEDIPARMPAGMAPRRTRASAGTASLSASPGPPAAAKRTGSGLFPSASSSRKSSDAGPGAERRGSMGGVRVRAVVQV